MPALNDLASQAFDGSDSYGDKVHFVHIYVVEPHPRAPDVSPYTTSVWEAEYSSLGQAFSYDERVSAAQTMATLADSQLLLVDDLRDGSADPVWCTYGPCPNCAYLIGQDGHVAAAQTWVNATDLQRDIDDLL